MKKLIDKVFWVFLLLGLSLPGRAQKQNIYITDESSHKPIPFATAIVLHKLQGGKATEYGKIPFPISRGDSVYISAVGYKDSTFVITNGSDSLRLQRDFIVMESVVVKQKVYGKKITIGNGSNSKSKNLVGLLGPGKLLLWGQGRGAEFAELIKLPSTAHSVWLRKAYIPVAKENCWSSVYLSFYLVDSVTGFPGKQIFQKKLEPESWNLVKGHLVADIMSDSLILDDTKAIFISASWDERMEAVRPSNDGQTGNSTDPTCGTLLVFVSSSNQNCFARYISSGTYLWSQFPGPMKANSQTQFQTAFALDVVISK